MNKEQLKYIYTEAEERSLPRMIPRDVQVPLGSGKVVVLTGIRRSGKTSLLFDAMARLMASGVSRERETRSLDWARSRYPDIEVSLVCHEAPDTWNHDSRLIPAWQLLCGPG